MDERKYLESAKELLNKHVSKQIKEAKSVKEIIDILQSAMESIMLAHMTIKLIEDSHKCNQCKKDDNNETDENTKPNIH